MAECRPPVSLNGGHMAENTFQYLTFHDDVVLTDEYIYCIFPGHHVSNVIGNWMVALNLEIDDDYKSLPSWWQCAVQYNGRL